ncbi:thioredoxin domain-containing protein [Candidatus Woesearchaeota archaeon]|nr:thioredoxin domain-containing protein [Candidatus Woesearchaeota archaeon]
MMSFKRYSWIISLAILITVVIVIVNIDNILNIDLEAQDDLLSEEELVQIQQQQLQFQNNPDGILIEQFSDFECPMCRRAHPIVLNLLAKYNGKINFKFRHLPLDYHPDAYDAALASECARDQGRFIEFYDLLYRKGAGSPEAYAKALGLDMQAFNECFISEEKAPIIEKDVEEAMQRGVQGTPWFFVDGQSAWLDELEPMIIDKLQK